MDAINGDASLSADQRNKKYEVQFKKQAIYEKSIEDTSKMLLKKYGTQLDAGTIAKLEENVSPEITEVPEEGPMAGEPMAWETPAPVEMAPIKAKKIEEKELDFDIDVVEPEAKESLVPELDKEEEPILLTNKKSKPVAAEDLAQPSHRRGKKDQAKYEQAEFKREHVAKAKAKHTEKIMPYIRKQESKDAAADRVLTANASEFVKLGVEASDVNAVAELIAESDRMNVRIEKLAKAYPGTGAAQERDRLADTEAEYGAELKKLLGKDLMADEKAMKRLTMLANEREEMGGVQKKLHADVKRDVKAHHDVPESYFEKGGAPELAIMKELNLESDDETPQLFSDIKKVYQDTFKQWEAHRKDLGNEIEPLPSWETFMATEPVKPKNAWEKMKRAFIPYVTPRNDMWNQMMKAREELSAGASGVNSRARERMNESKRKAQKGR